MTRSPHTPEFPRPRLGVSACLLGEPVRYDGGHKRHAFLADVLAAHLDCVPLCPEAGIGMGVPRAPIHLVGERDAVRALGVQDPSVDVTARLQRFAIDRRDELGTLSGFLFKKDSPSCGVRGVRLLAVPGHLMQRRGTGIFAAAVSAALPLLPLEQEDALDYPLRRENFICRLYVYRRWQALLDNGLSIASLQAFHTAHEHLVKAHSQAACRRLARLSGSPDSDPLQDTAGRYIRELMRSLARPATRERHSTVQRELAGLLQARLDNRHRSILTKKLDAYRAGTLPLQGIVAALREPFERCEPPCASGYAYLYPYPDSFQLRESL